MSDFKEYMADVDGRKAAEFNKWLAKPEIKMLISLMPPLTTDTQHEAFNALLKSVFSVGHDVGSAGVAASMLNSMFEARDKRGS